MTSNPSTQPVALFRFDASPKIGGGHAMRCLTLADALAGMGWQCHFMVGSETVATVPILAESVHGIIVLGNVPVAQSIKQLMSGKLANLLVVDHYGLDADFESACRSFVQRIMVIDDLANRRHNCDILFDQSLGRVAKDYEGLVPEHCRIVIGPNYALLRPQFRANRFVSLCHRRELTRISRILVSLGATDPNNTTSTVLTGIGQSGMNVEVDVVLGGSSPHLATLRNLVGGLPQKIVLHNNVTEMATLLSRADLCIGAAGGSALERCCLGLPSLIIVTADNQRSNAHAFEKADAAIVLGEAEAVTPDSISMALRELSQDAERLARIRTISSMVCDGLGTRRVAMILSPCLAKDGYPVELRPATMADADQLLAWQKHPNTRRYARNPQVPEPKEHYRWLSTQLMNSDCLLNIIFHNHHPSGVLRLDLLQNSNGNQYEISIFTAPDRYRLGIGSCALKLSRMLLPDADLSAFTFDENFASTALFESSGFARQNDGHYINYPSKTFSLVST